MTRNDKTREVIATVKKVRLGNLDIYSPKRAADWRISVNVEVPGAYLLILVVHGRDRFSPFLTVQHPLGSPVYSRRKDRISYTHEEFVVDLTQVTSYGGSGSQVGYVALPKLLNSTQPYHSRSYTMNWN